MRRPGVHMSFCLSNNLPTLSLGIKSKNRDNVQTFSNTLSKAGFDYPLRGPYKKDFYECRTRNGVDRILDLILPYLSQRRNMASQLLAVYRDQIALRAKQSRRELFNQSCDEIEARLLEYGSATTVEFVENLLEHLRAKGMSLPYQVVGAAEGTVIDDPAAAGRALPFDEPHQDLQDNGNAAIRSS